MSNYELNGVNGQLKITEEYVIITRKGLLGFMTQGLAGEKRIPFDSIKAVQLKDGGMINGFIQLSVLGGVEKKGGAFNATQDENTVMFTYKYNDLAKEIRAFIEKRIIELRNSNSPVVNQISAADEILKYKKLLDSGIITEEEFNQKKKSLLGI